MHSLAIHCSTSDTSYSLYHFVNNKALFAVISLDFNVPLVSGCGDSQIKAQLLHVYLEKP
jgi:hypothetical protein